MADTPGHADDRAMRREATGSIEHGWNLIASAPKDGTKILAYCHRNGRDVYAVTWWRLPEDKAGYVGWGEFNTQYWPPTHWLPLMAPRSDAHGALPSDEKVAQP